MKHESNANVTQSKLEKHSESTPKMYPTNFYVAVHFLGNSLILLNNIVKIDDTLFENLCSELDDEQEIFQYFVTDFSEDDVEFAEEHFGLKFAYSELLDKYILLVTHFGTSWDYVYWETDLPTAEAELGELKGRRR